MAARTEGRGRLGLGKTAMAAPRGAHGEADLRSHCWRQAEIESAGDVLHRLAGERPLLLQRLPESAWKAHPRFPYVEGEVGQAPFGLDKAEGSEDRHVVQ